MNTIKSIIYAFTLLVIFIAPINAQRPLAYSKEEPIRLDFDMESTEKPKPVATGYLYDLIDGTIFQPIRRSANVQGHLRRLGGRPKESINVNVLDEVPNSSWFTNRIGFREMSLEEIIKGPNRSDGPSPGKLRVIRGKNIGVTPGFWVKDEQGEIYILKFDPPEYPELATGAEIIGTKMFHAFGYNVPENHIFRFRRNDLEIEPGAKITNAKNEKEKLTDEKLNLILSKVARQKDGRYRSLASRLIKGEPIGGFGFSGRRKDDPNDIIPHEIRRDVRALKIFAAWTEHNDLRVGNTLDFYVGEDERRFIRHYLIDFGSTFGSDSIQPNLPEAGREHGLDFDEAAKVLLSGGLYQPPWRNKKSVPIYSPAIGRYSTKFFRPNKWKSNFSLAALGQMTTSDGLWAAKIISAFKPEQIRAIVKTAEYSNPKDTEYLVREIIARQIIIARYYFSKRSGLGAFAVQNEGGRVSLKFKDLRMKYPTEKPIPDQYKYRIETVGKGRKILSKGLLNSTELDLNADLLRLIAGSGRAKSEKGIAKLSLGRPGEKTNALVYIWSRAGADPKIAGIVY